jgi:nucleotide-binding universal stress UspA family protein
MKTLLITTDFGQGSTHSLEMAISLARQNHARLCVLHTYHFSSSNSFLGIPQDDTQQELIMSRKEAEINLLHWHDMIVKQFGKEGLPELKLKLVEGEVAEGILKAAEEEHVDLIVMNAHSRHNFMGKIASSRAIEVSRHAHCPVLVIPDKWDQKTIRSMVYAADLRKQEAGFIDTALQFAQVFGASLEVIHITPESEFHPGSVTDALMTRLHNEYQDKPVHFKMYKAENPVNGLEEYLSQQHTDLVVLAHEERYFWQRLFHKSVTEQLIKDAPTALLVLHKG